MKQTLSNIQQTITSYTGLPVSPFMRLMPWSKSHSILC